MRADDLLPDSVNQGEFNGVVVRKGSVGAFLANAKLRTDPTRSALERATAERHIIEALPALRALGLFDALQIRDEELRSFVEAH
jgi:hypothetical protein